MKKAIIISMLVLFLPIIIHAETITYNVCESGCEYQDLYTVQEEIKSLGDLSDTDVIININSDYTTDFSYNIEDNAIKSLTINGNNHTVKSISAVANNIDINEIIMSGELMILNSQKTKISNSNISRLAIFFAENDQLYENEFDLNEILEIDDESFSNVNTFFSFGNIKIENMDFKNIVIETLGGTLNIYNSKISKTLGLPLAANVRFNFYNCELTSLKFKTVTSLEEYESGFDEYFENNDMTSLNYDFYDINATNMGLNGKSITTVYFDKELEVKPNDKIKISEYLDYYTEDKKTDYVIEDESIAKMENKELVGLKDGQTNITITTDEGHVVYRIKLNVIKEIEIPLSGINIKTSAFIIGIVLLGVISVCIYLLIRNKKVKEKK